MTGKLYTIKDVSTMTGVHAQTLRNWEKEELIEPLRVAGNQRIYTDEHIERVVDIMKLKEQGYQLKGVRNVLLGKMQSAAKATKSVASKAVKDLAPKSEPLMSAAQTLEKTRPQKSKTVETSSESTPEEFSTEMEAVTSQVETPAASTPTSPSYEEGFEEGDDGERYSAEDLAEMGNKTLAAIARAEGIRYFRQMNKEELVIAISTPDRRQEMIDQVKSRLNKDKAPEPVAAVAPEEVPEITEEKDLKEEGIAEANVVEDAKEEMDTQKMLIQQILQLGNSGKSPEEIAKALAKAYE